MTNAEQIRHMTDEDLARLLANISAASVALKRPIRLEAIEEWLKKEEVGKL